MARKIRYIDPPKGWLFGFPKVIPNDVKDVHAWLVENGYPKAVIESLGSSFNYRMWESDEKPTKTKYLIIGDTCLDVFVYGSVKRLSPEAPIPVFVPSRTIENHGMAGNVSKNLVSILGSKSFDSHIVNLIISKNNVRKTRYVDESTNHYFIRVDDGKCVDTINLKKKTHLKYIREADIILISDYDKGFISLHDIDQICMLKKEGSTLFLDTKKKIPLDIFDKIDYVKFNSSEYERHIHLLDNNPHLLKKVIITKGSNGAEYNGVNFGVDKQYTMDVSGAGDTFLAGLAYHYANYKLIESAIKYANKIASNVVSQRGVAIANPNIELNLD